MARDHALVMGGSIAGLLAAAALSPSFKKVTVFERDGSAGMRARKGVPQGKHIHLMLASGRLAIDKLLNGLFDEMEEDGSVVADFANDLKWHHAGGWKCRFASNYPLYMQSRPFLEWHIRRRVEALGNVQVSCGESVESPVFEDGRVVGVTLEDGRVVAGDLIIDATGRGTRTARWLSSWGYERPDEASVKVSLAYASRVVKLQDDATRDWKGLVVYHVPPNNRRSGVIFPIEGGKCIVTLFGYQGDHPPADEEGFMEFARSLVQPDVADEISRAQPISPINVYKYPTQVRRGYHRISLPENYGVIGDAVCSFDPVFGQGMTVSAMAALALHDMVAAGKFSSHQFQRKLARIAAVPWFLTSSEAFRYPEAEGRKPPGSDLMRWYAGKIFEKCRYDPVTYAVFIRVMNLEASPMHLLSPRFLARFAVPH